MTNYIKNTANTLYKNLLNTIDGVDFNRNAHEESRNSSQKYHDPNSGPHEDWEHINMRSRLRAESSEGDFMIDEEEGVVRKIISRFSEKALASAAEAAGHSKSYAALATKYILMEMARDVGWVMNCRTAGDVMRSVHLRFPVLEDMKRAYEEGKMGVVEREQGRMMVRTREPVEGWCHPRDVNVASNLDDVAIWGDEGVRADFAVREGVVLGGGGGFVERGRRRARD